MAIDLAALRVEILTDPVGIGYPPWTDDETAGETSQVIADLINADRQVVGFKRFGVLMVDVREVFDPTDIDTMAPGSLAILQLYVGGGGREFFDFNNANSEAAVLAAFVPGAVSRTSLTNLAERATRAWELFGQPTVVANQNVTRALR